MRLGSALSFCKFLCAAWRSINNTTVFLGYSGCIFALSRGSRLSLHIEDMFSTGHDEAKRVAGKRSALQDRNIAGLALRDDKKTVGKVAKGARMRP
jgi:hypothetical protein